MLAALALPAFARAQEPYLDVRAQAKPVAVSPETRALERRLGPQGVVEIDPSTGTPRVVARLDGALTAPAEGGAAAIAERYVREQRAALGVDFDTLQPPQVTRRGDVRVVRWRQAVDGIAAADGELQVNVADDGRVLSVLGSPAPALPTGTTPSLTAGEAVRAVQDDVGVYRPLVKRKGVRSVDYADGTKAELTLFAQKLAWRVTYRASSQAVYDVMVDAEHGKVLRRANLVKSVKGLVWENHPGATFGGTADERDLPGLNAASSTLENDFIHTFKDLNDNDKVDGGEEVVPGVYAFTPVGNCDLPCSWSGSSTTWQTNQNQNAVQAFYLANQFQQYLARAPINFNEFDGVDKVEIQTLDGASTGPDGDHINNANMFTPREDSKSPVMQMYLWRGPSHRNVNGGDDASILFHEYAHGLSNRLVTEAGGGGALNSAQAGAMGEGWSDFYAKDYLVERFPGLDSGTPNELKLGVYVDAPGTFSPIRVQGLDCPVGDPRCPGLEDKPGGFTYGDFGFIDGGPAVHADGEIWAETLWDLRNALGAEKARGVITRGMDLYTPPEPSFLDARNGILLAADVADRATIWAVFAKRGMGFFATAVDGGDTRPLEDFSLPPSPYGPRGTIAGRVIDALTASPVAGATISIGGNSDGPDALATTTDANGNYELSVPPGPYPNVLVRRAGYDRVVASGTVATDQTITLNASLKRDWADRSSATVTSQDGIEYEPYGCGPSVAVDGNQSTAWSTDYVSGQRKPLVVQLPDAIDVTSFGVDPTAGCGDGTGASTASYQIETSPTGLDGSWTTRKSGTFVAADLHRLNLVGLAAPVSAVRYVRFTPQTPMVGSSAFLDLSEFTVYGRPLPKTTITAGPTTVDSDATPTFTFTSDQANATFACALVRDEIGGPPPPPAERCTSPYTPQQPLADGDYYLEVTSISASGGFGAPARREWTLNTALPDTTITAGPGAFTNNPRPTFTVTGPNPTCTWDGVAGPCARTTDLADGRHTFSAAANNAAGADPTPATRSFTVDTVKPVPSLLGETSGGDAVSYAFAATDATPVTFTCVFDGVSAPCKSTTTYTGLANGRHTFVLTATDAAGNSASLPQRTFDVNLTDYDTRLDSGPSGLIATPDVQFTFSSPNGGSVFECSLDGADFEACTSPRDEFVAEGPHTFDVRAVGEGSRRDPTPAHAAFTVDTTPPETILDAIPATFTSGAAVVGFRATEPATFVCSVDGAPESACASPLTLPGLSLGRHTLTVSAIDLAGNIDPEPARADFQVQAPPAATPTPTPSPTPTPTPTAKPALEKVTVVKTVSLKTLRKAGKLRLSVRTAAGARVSVTAKVGTKTLGTAKRTATGSLTLKLSKSKLKRARKGQTITLRITATGRGLITTTDTRKVKLRT